MRQRGIVTLDDSDRASRRRGYSRLTRVRKARFLIIWSGAFQTSARFIMPYEPIENYGVIGDLQTVALVGMNGSIDFMCFPHFDSPSIFAALLDHKRGGRFQLAPILRGERRKQIYFPDTNMLLTRVLSADGVAEVSDFMPIKAAGHAHHLVRRAQRVRGALSFRMVCAPARDYGRGGRTHRAMPRSV